MFERLKRAASRTRGGRRGHKFRIDVWPREARWGVAKTEDARDVVVLQCARGAKLATSKPSSSSSRESTPEGDVVAVTWDETCAPMTSVSTLYRRANGGGFEEKRFAMKLSRRGTTTTTTTTAKGAVDFASFATLETSDVNVRRTFELEMKRGGGVARVECDVRVTWLRHFGGANDVDGMTELTEMSAASALESEATDVTPRDDGGDREQDLSGFANLLSPVAESVSPIVVRQSERREEAAREARDEALARVAELEAAMERGKAESEIRARALESEKRSLEGQLERAREEARGAREDVKSANEAKSLAVDRVVADIEAIEREKNAVVRENKELEFKVEALERALRERDADVERLKNAQVSGEEASVSAEILKHERVAHAKAIERYKEQLDAADAQLDAILRDHKNEKVSFEKELELQQKIRAEAERVLEEELDEKHRECEDLRQQFQHVVTETTQLATALRRAAKEEQHSLTNIAKAEAQQAKCDLQAVTEELSDVRKVLDSHVSELIACKVSMAESDGVAVVLRRELARAKDKLAEYACRCTRMESVCATLMDESNAMTTSEV
jgi:hypothetical protein